jgi:DNA-binding transcriptional MerR regulator
MQTPSSTQNTQEMNKLQNYLNAIPENGWVDLQEIKRILAEQFAQSDRERKENERIFNEKFAKSERKMKELQELIGGIGNSNGDMAEEYFFNAFKKNKTFMNQTFDKVLRNKWIDTDDWKAEFDLLLLNGKSAVIIEVKYKADYNIKIQKLVSRVRPFKALFPEYKHHDIYLGVAAMSFNKYLAMELRETGIATIHQVGNKMVVYDQEVKVF